MKIHHLKALVAIADTGSVSAAARSCELSPPAITKAIQELESELGLLLLVRESRGVAFTEAGKSLLVHARLITTQIHKSMDEMASLLHKRDSHLKIAVSPWIALSILGETVRLFQRQMPDVQLEFHEALAGTTASKLRDGSLDLAIGRSSSLLMQDEFQCVPLFETSSAVVCRVGHPRAEVQSLSDLAGCEWVLNADPRDDGKSDDPFKKYCVDYSPRIHISHSFVVAIGLIASLDMLGLMPWPLVEALTGREKLRVIPIQETLNPAVTSLLTRRGDPLSASARHFVDSFVAVTRHAHESADSGQRRLFHSFDRLLMPTASSPAPVKT